MVHCRNELWGKGMFFCGSKLRYDLLSTMNIMNMVSEFGSLRGLRFVFLRSVFLTSELSGSHMN